MIVPCIPLIGYYIYSHFTQKSLRVLAGNTALPTCPGNSPVIWTNCFGVISNPAGDKIFGEWQDGKLNGWGGYYHLANNDRKGDKYLGEWKDNKQNGFGIETLNDGSNYAGWWKNDLRDGVGVQTSSGGNKYVGEWRGNEESGQGTYYTLDNSLYKGDIYIGEHKARKMNGWGTYKFANGDVYVGEFRDNKRNGKGTLTYADGRPPLDSGIWKDDSHFFVVKQQNRPQLNNSGLIQQLDPAENK